MPNLDWDNLGFNYMRTNCHVRYTWKDGKWDNGALVEGDTITLSIAADCLHYGQAAFEGLKAFRCKDGKIRVFRPEENAKRMYHTAERTCMAPPPVGMFVEAVKRVIRANEDFVPPYGTGGSMYIRPLLIGSAPQIGVAPASEYTFLVFVMPVGSYYKGGIKPVRALIYDEYDRAAPLGMGNVKVAGNYAASLYAHESAKRAGFPVELYLDAKTHTFVEEFATSNFIGIKGGSYITPNSQSVLPSITNDTLRIIAEDFGMKVERRPIPYDELKYFDEIGACGTAVVVTPVCEIVRGGDSIRIGSPDECGPMLRKFHDTVEAIRFGELPDTHGWCVEV